MPFVPGLDLSRRFYREEVRPILDAAFPDLVHSAALLGRGSEVLGFDDEMSTDHDWKSRVLIFLTDRDDAQHREDIDAVLGGGLPAQFHGFQTDYSIFTVREYFRRNMDVNVDVALTARDWLTFSEQQLCTVTAGAVFHDGAGLHTVRDRFAYYPHDVWLYLLISAWWRVHPEANLVGRAGYVGDDLGSALIGSRLVHDLMRLCFLMERTYAPYAKWFTTAFARLDCAAEMMPILTAVLRSPTWPEREDALLTAYGKVAAMHNALGITDVVATDRHQLWGRPFTVLWGDFPAAIKSRITDPEVKQIADRWPVGGIDELREVLLGPRPRELLSRLLA